MGLGFSPRLPPKRVNSGTLWAPFGRAEGWATVGWLATNLPLLHSQRRLLKLGLPARPLARPKHGGVTLTGLLVGGSAHGTAQGSAAARLANLLRYEGVGTETPVNGVSKLPL